MDTQLLGLWSRIRSSYWFLPSLMLIMSVALSLFMIRLDEAVEISWIRGVAWLYINEAESARTLLSTIAGSMITVAGITYSIVIVALTLASSQFGPRLLRNFMRDTGNQVVLGTYIATFMYCLLILRNVRMIDGVAFIPHLSIALALFLATLSLGVLIYFIHHAAASIQISSILAGVGKEMESNIAQFFPERIGEEPPEETAPRLPRGFTREAAPLSTLKSGYLQTVDEDGLYELAREHDLLLSLNYRPGDFVVEGGELVKLWPGERLTDALKTAIRNKFIIGDYRTQGQDLGFLFDQLVEVAARALSPGINDPFTALLCIDRIGAGLAFMTERKIPSAYRYDSGKLRVIAVPVSFEDAVSRSFGPIRRYGAGSLLIILALFRVIEMVARRTTTAANRQVLLTEAGRVRDDAHQGLGNQEDREEARRAYSKALATIQKAPPRPVDSELSVLQLERKAGP